MKRFTHLIITFITLALFCLTLPKTAYAYLDPGTGSYVIQMIIAALVGVAFVIKIYWGKTKTFLANLISKRPRDREDDE